jgi:polysaccharide biosynthesis/export protein
MTKLVVTVLAVLACSPFCAARDWAADLPSGDALHVSVTGEAHAPGLYAVTGDGSIASLLTQAGGVSDMAADTIYIERADESGQIKRYSISLHDPLRMGEAHLLREGDKLVIPRALEYSITGEVQKPGTYRLDLSLTVAQAVAKANGGTIFANLRRFEVRRKKDDGIVVIQVSPNDFVEPDDVIRVKIAFP